jgi:hypothetical protein
VVLIDEGSPLQVTLAVLVSGWAHVLHAMYKPWGAGTMLYRLQHCALFVTSYVFVMGLLFKVDGVTSGSDIYGFLAACTLLAILAFVVAWLASVIVIARNNAAARRTRAPEPAHAAGFAVTRALRAPHGKTVAGAVPATASEPVASSLSHGAVNPLFRSRVALLSRTTESKLDSVPEADAMSGSGGDSGGNGSGAAGAAGAAGAVGAAATVVDDDHERSDGVGSQTPSRAALLRLNPTAEPRAVAAPTSVGRKLQS